MNRLTDKERKALVDDMRSFDEQMPCVGVFRYDPVGHRLIGVRKSEVTPKMVEDAADKGVSFIDHPQGESKYGAEGDCCGRVVWSIDKFMVLVGKWAESIHEKLTELLEKEFSLPCFEFVFDEHRDLGHSCPRGRCVIVVRLGGPVGDSQGERNKKDMFADCE